MPKTKKEKLFEILLSCCGILFIINLYAHSSVIKNIIIVEDPTFTNMGPIDQVQLRFPINHSRLIDRDFEFLIQPQDCPEEDFLLLIIIHSSPGNWEYRKAIRQTWGKASDAIKVVFMLGETTDANVSKNVDKEIERHGDIVIGNFLDSYKNLTYKHVMGLKWTAQHCARARYVLKTDDDVYVNIRQLVRYLIREMSPWGAQGLIACTVMDGMPVIRDTTSKWFVSNQEYKPNTYLPYCSGYFILYSQDVAQMIVLRSETVAYMFIDDFYVTGLIADLLSIPQTDIYELSLENKQIKKDARNEVPFLVSPVNQSPDQILSWWKKVGNNTKI